MFLREPEETQPMTRDQLAALKAKNLPHVCAADYFTKDEECEPERFAELMAIADKYFHAFVKYDGLCVCCGKPQGVTASKSAADAIVQMLTQGHYFTWGIANGEGYCMFCKYPARAIHRIEGVGTIQHLILQYHPDGLESL